MEIKITDLHIVLLLYDIPLLFLLIARVGVVISICKRIDDQLDCNIYFAHCSVC